MASIQAFSPQQQPKYVREFMHGLPVYVRGRTGEWLIVRYDISVPGSTTYLLMRRADGYQQYCTDADMANEAELRETLLTDVDHAIGRKPAAPAVCPECQGKGMVDLSVGRARLVPCSRGCKVSQ